MNEDRVGIGLFFKIHSFYLHTKNNKDILHWSIYIAKYFFKRGNYNNYTHKHTFHINFNYKYLKEMN